jgi:UDP-N-acetyl-D-galactosamine dehydrogenase
MNIYEKLINHKEKLVVIGLGYVGLPLAIEFSKYFKVIGFDTNSEKIEEYKRGVFKIDLDELMLKDMTVEYISDSENINAKVFVIAVPTPVTFNKKPDLSFLISASKIVAKNLTSDSVVIYESTVYPGSTENICLPILEKVSGLKCGKDFYLGYSPERINPGDKLHTLCNTTKIIAGWNQSCLEIIEKIYSKIIISGIYKAPNIKVAEAAKIIENVQRDVNIAFANEMAIVLNESGINYKEVFDAARTKWNFYDVFAGLVGGHCIGVDSYYLQYFAKEKNIDTKLIDISREINETMAIYIAKRIIALLKNKSDKKVFIYGFTYKENSSDIRNTKVFDLLQYLITHNINVCVSDYLADCDSVYKEYGINLNDERDLMGSDAIVFAIKHRQYCNTDFKELRAKVKNKDCIIVDLNNIFFENDVKKYGFKYWCL